MKTGWSRSLGYYESAGSLPSARSTARATSTREFCASGCREQFRREQENAFAN